ncbi:MULTISPECIES: type II/IV secretion system protein [unclassified Sphingomonas]|uniref:GspE/PulE family protein n=1 Tax=Novosphingobium rhizosphaerae TaxID=1551649 RepID=UPI0015C72D6A
MADFLASSGLVPRETLGRAQAVQRESGERLESVITRLGLVSEQTLVAALAQACGLAPATDLPDAAINAAPPMALAFLQDVRAAAIAADATHVRVAVADPFDPFVEQAFAAAWQRRVERVVARPSDIDALLERLALGTAAASGDSEDDGVETAVDGEAMERLRDMVSDAPAIRAVNRLIAQAVDERASDIHLEPADDALIVRLRIDGMLREIPALPAALKASVVARIKVMAGLDIAEKRLPQDGRLRLAVRGHAIDLRVATAPSIQGESVVLRILDRSNLSLDFAALGFDADLAEAVRQAVHRPHGIMLVTGPTGSGKTTTLYAALACLNGVERKLLTVEDPIEYRLPSVVQAQVQPAIGFTFAAALRSFLRQDPDVIMVGEIRDGETARIAVQAALTGHMILSTLHTNTAAGAVTRLADMGVEPFLLASVLAGVLSQRLVRRLCSACAVPYPADAALCARLGLPAGTTLKRPTGCERCRGSGYAGRVALFEYLPVTPALERLILQSADTTAMEACADAQGRRSLLADGGRKAALGLTSAEEVLRVGLGE